MRVGLVRRRLRNQQLVRPTFRAPGDVVAWLGAVQAQDYSGAKWALGMRATGVTDAHVEQAFSDGAILRTHLLRPTWHFVASADIRWILDLSAPRVHAANAPYYRKAGLDAQTLGRSRAVLERALVGGRQLTRTELAVVLGRAGIQVEGHRLAYLMMHEELDGVICSGARRGKQFTYALLEERVPRAGTLPRDEALAELTRRYFASHGPATVKDCAWWSGLTMRDVKAGLDMITPALAHETIDGRKYWFAASTSATTIRPASAAYLLPNYDEYLIAYKDRDLVTGPPWNARLRPGATDPFAHHLVIEGGLAGSWKRTVKGGSTFVDVAPYRRLTRPDARALAAAVESLGRFMSMAVDWRDGYH